MFTVLLNYNRKLWQNVNKRLFIYKSQKVKQLYIISLNYNIYVEKIESPKLSILRFYDVVNINT